MKTKILLGVIVIFAVFCFSLGREMRLQGNGILDSGKQSNIFEKLVRSNKNDKSNNSKDLSDLGGIGAYDTEELERAEIVKEVSTVDGNLEPNIDWSSREVTYDDYCVLLACANSLIRVKYGNNFTIVQPTFDEMSNFDNAAFYEVIDGIMLLKVRVESPEVNYATVKLYYDGPNLYLVGVD